MLELRKVTKSYGLHHVLDIDQQYFEKGLSYVKGRNGSGKSTLLKLIAGLIDFNGQVLLEGCVCVKKHPLAYRKRVNFAEAEPVFPSFVTGGDLIDLFLRTKNGSKEEVDGLIELFSMKEYLHDLVACYSAGMMKKLSIILAFIGSPKIILLDEPFITLDTTSLEQLSHLIYDYIVDKGVSFIVTSHQALPKEIPVHNTFLLENRRLHKLSSE